MSDQAHDNTRQQKGRRYPPGYGIVEPVANYRPWDVDEEFAAVYELVREHTMVDVYRLWTLWFVARQIARAETPGDVLEIGSWRGGSGTVIARALASAAGPGAGGGTARPATGNDAGAGTAGSATGNDAGAGDPSGGTPRRSVPRTVFLADTFAGVVKASARDTYYKGGEHANTSADLVRALLTRAAVTDVRLLAGVFPEDRGAEIADRTFALCHIDVDVYQSAKDCFEWVWPRMAPGGGVVFDDYGFYGCEGVTAYVNELAAEPAVGSPVVPGLSGQAIITRAVY